MNDQLYMAWKYIAYNRFKSAVLMLSIILIVYIPVGLHVLIRQSERQLTARAEASPLLIGAKGSPLELVLNSLYFNADVPEMIRYDEAGRVEATRFAMAIPLHVRFRSSQDPIVGTTIEYFEFRGLAIDAGRPIALLGECVVGAEVASRRGIKPGDHLVSSPENVFDLAGVYPLKLRVAGVLAFADSPDDEAIFIDVKTAWVIEGLAHGHEDLSKLDAASGVLGREANRITANASVVQYNEITDENIDSFHFHGDSNAFPITAILAVPHDHKSAALLMGRYQSELERHQLVEPITVLDELMATIFTVQRFVIAALATVGLATLASVVLVFLLSLRIRQREIETMMKIGGARGTIASILATEIFTVIILSLVFAAALTWVTSQYAATAIRLLVKQ